MDKNIFECLVCNFKTDVKCNYQKHLETLKHKERTEYKCNTCGNFYKHDSSLYRHRRNCGIQEPAQSTIQEPVQSTNVEKPTPAVGQMWFNPETGSFFFWNGHEWAAMPTPAKETTDIQDKIIIKPEIKVYPPNIDTDIIKTVVTTSMDNWLDTASYKSPPAEHKVTEPLQPDPIPEEPGPMENKTEDSPATPIDGTPEPGYNSVDDTFHPQEHFKPTHITYGKR